jgi:hypothetical protein
MRAVCVKEVEEGLWLVSNTDNDLRCVDREEKFRNLSTNFWPKNVT